MQGGLQSVRENGLTSRFEASLTASRHRCVVFFDCSPEYSHCLHERQSVFENREQGKIVPWQESNVLFSTTIILVFCRVISELLDKRFVITATECCWSASLRHLRTYNYAWTCRLKRWSLLRIGMVPDIGLLTLESFRFWM
jgi:hypothetical protein